VGIGLAIVVALVLGLASLARLGIGLGLYLKTALGPFGFLGNALFIVADFVDIFLPALGGLVGLLVLFSFASSLGSRILKTSGEVLGRVYTVVVATLAAGLLTGIICAGIGWLYQVEHPIRFIGVPAIVVAVIVLVISLRSDVNRPVPIGAIVYNITRTILNALRSIEPLIMVVAFAVWVGIGPFAGVMALALHTIASLGKLYSEQVENILTGPVEAVTATGANFLQTIVYAVIPQIIPSYTAFTIYRWDINVRMSTIIGFGGGGGIGFLVQQNLNLLKYRDASVQMIAIAIVVATLDYASSKIRQKII
jgi:ABC-type methionine transport system permease subunit